MRLRVITPVSDLCIRIDMFFNICDNEVEAIEKAIDDVGRFEAGAWIDYIL